MAFTKSRAFVLKRFRYGETSIIATLFSQEDGMFGAMIKGARKPKSRNSGVFEILNNISFTYNKKENRELQYISSAECINSFEKIKENLDKLSIAYSCIEIMSKAHYYYENSQSAYQLLDNTLTCLNNYDKNIDNVYIYFLMFLSKCTGHFILDKFDNSETFRNIDSFKTIEKVIDLLKELTNINLKDLEELNIEDSLYTKTKQMLLEHLNESELIPFSSNVTRAISQMKFKQ